VSLHIIPQWDGSHQSTVVSFYQLRCITILGIKLI